jgi:hypothetical protein
VGEDTSLKLNKLENIKPSQIIEKSKSAKVLATASMDKKASKNNQWQCF